MYTSKLRIKTSSVNAWRSLRWWPDLSDCLVTSSISQGRPQKKPADHNCWDNGEARREDLGWQSEDVVWRRQWRQTGRGWRGTGPKLGCLVVQTVEGRFDKQGTCSWQNGWNATCRIEDQSTGSLPTRLKDDDNDDDDVYWAYEWKLLCYIMHGTCEQQ